MARSSGLTSWIAQLDPGALEQLLRARPDAARMPPPSGPGELAARLHTALSVQRALPLLTLPALQVAETLLALGGQAPRTKLATLLGVPTTDPGLDAALTELTDLALAWPVGAQLHVVGSLGEIIAFPLQLGRPARVLFAQLTVAQLTRIGSALGLGGLSRKAQSVDAIAAAVTDPTAVAARLDRAGPELIAAVEEIAWDGPRVSGVRLPPTNRPSGSYPVEFELALHGWVVADEWGAIGEMPGDVALAVRGSGYRAPFDRAPAQPPTAPVEASRSTDASRQAAGAAVDVVRRLLALLDASPPATLQAGGVGVREQRRMAKQLGLDEAAVRLWLEVGAEAELLAPSDAGDVLPTTQADDWLVADPTDALVTLLAAWWALPIVPGHHLDEAGKQLPALAHMFAGVGPPLRSDVFAELAALGPGRGLADPADLAPLALRLAHRRPVLLGMPSVVEPALRATLAEAALLGLVVDGALTPLGAALRACPTDLPALRRDFAEFLAAPASTAMFLPDLTAVVAGAVGPALARVLDEAADAEVRDTASAWRFSPASVRRALDGGRDAGGLLAALAAVADNPLPQPLTYLVRDVARRHGELEVVPAACCVVVADAALAAEVAAHRKLAALKLRRLGDTVLASAKAGKETLAALRAAGYVPVRRDAAGAPVVDRAATRRAETPRASTARAVAEIIQRTQPDLAALARRLAGGKPATSDDHTAADALTITLADAPALSPAEAAVLDFAVRHGAPVLIDYLSAGGSRSTRVIEQVERFGDKLVAWCRLRQAERHFALSRILAVSPAEP